MLGGRAAVPGFIGLNSVSTTDNGSGIFRDNEIGKAGRSMRPIQPDSISVDGVKNHNLFAQARAVPGTETGLASVAIEQRTTGGRWPKLDSGNRSLITTSTGPNVDFRV